MSVQALGVYALLGAGANQQLVEARKGHYGECGRGQEECGYKAGSADEKDKNKIK